MKRILLIIASVVMLALGFAAASSATGDEPRKVIVCKYVGTPGVGEVLQTGDNPIQVSQNAIPGFGGTFPFEFADAQGKSLAVRYAVDNADRGTLSDCPGGDTPPPPFDACPNIEGNQPEGTKCETPPPFDQCPSIAGDQPRGTDCNPPPPPPRCPPGMTPTAGKDGQPGNDECEGPKPPTPPVVTTPITPVVTTPTVPAPTTPAPTTPAPTTPAPTTPETTPEATTPDEPKAPSQKELEKELKEQEKKNGAPGAGPAPEAVPGELPKTGLPLGLVALLGASLTAGGLAMRRVR